MSLKNFHDLKAEQPEIYVRLMYPVKFYIDPETFSFDTMQINAIQFENQLGGFGFKAWVAQLYYKIWKEPGEESLAMKSTRYYDETSYRAIMDINEIDIR